MKLQENLKRIYHVLNYKNIQIPKLDKIKIKTNKKIKKDINRSGHTIKYIVLILKGNRKDFLKLDQKDNWLSFIKKYHANLNQTIPYGKKIEVTNPHDV